MILAILVVVNILVSALPTSMTKYDISSAKLYSVTSNTKAVLSGLDEDVTIYWIVQAGMEDDILENLLGKYESLSDHITVEKKNPCLSHLCPAVHQRDCTEQQPDRRMRGPEPVHRL